MKKLFTRAGRVVALVTGLVSLGAVSLGLASLGLSSFGLSSCGMVTSGNDNADAPIYGIRLRSDTANGVTALEGYETPPAITITIVNESNRDTGPLAITIAETVTAGSESVTAGSESVTAGTESVTAGTESASFKLETGSIGNIMAGGSSEFRVSPKTGLDAGTYSATVTVAPAAGNRTGIQPQTVNVSFKVESSRVGIDLLVGGALSRKVDFGTVVAENYAAPDPKTVVIFNKTDALIPFLTIALDKADAFRVSPEVVNDIQTGNYASFRVETKSGLAPRAEAYTAKVWVKGAANGISESIDVAFTVEPKRYGIGLSEGETVLTETSPPLEFEVQAPYTADDLEAKTIMISNTGNQPTGKLTIALTNTTEGSTSADPAPFILSKDTIASIPEGNTTSPFTVKPNTDLEADGNNDKTYTATVKVSGENDILAEFTVSFKVRPTVEISLSVEGADADGTYTFTDSGEAVITVTNTGNQPTGPLTITHSGGSRSDAAFTASETTTIESIDPDDSKTFKVTLTTDAALPGWNDGKINVESAANSSVIVKPTYLNVRLHKSVPMNEDGTPAFTFDSVDAVTEYLQSYAGYTTYGTDNAPLLLPVKTDLTSEKDGWAALTKAIDDAKKYVALDLSDSSVGADGVFDTGGTYETGGIFSDKVVSIIFPDNATIIAEHAFLSWEGSTTLKSITFANPTVVRAYAFAGNDSLSIAPLAGKIVGSAGDYAFAHSSALKDLLGGRPAANRVRASVGKAFNTATLPDGTVSFPGMTNIGAGLFAGRPECVSLSFPDATDIGNSAFYNCPNLSFVDLPVAVTLGDKVFGLAPAETDLTITMGNTPPTTVGAFTFFDATGKTVNVQVTNAGGYNDTWKSNFKATDGGTVILTINGEHESFADVLRQMHKDADKDDVTYTIAASGTETYMSDLTLNTTNSPATVVIDGGGRVITGSANRITVGTGVSLTLKNITFTTLPLTVSGGGKLVLETGAVIQDNAGTGVTVSGTLEMKDGALVKNNRASGVVLKSTGVFTMDGGKISGNTASKDVINDTSGGGVLMSGSAKFYLTGGEISGNSAGADGAGGGVSVYDTAEFNLSGSGKVSGNTAADGGGVYMDGKSTANRAILKLSGGEISDNTASDGGGGVYVLTYGLIEMSGGTISGNTSTKYGAAIYLDYKSELKMTGGLIENNTANGGASGSYSEAGITISEYGGCTMSPQNTNGPKVIPYPDGTPNSGWGQTDNAGIIRNNRPVNIRFAATYPANSRSVP